MTWRLRLKNDTKNIDLCTIEMIENKNDEEEFMLPPLKMIYLF